MIWVRILVLVYGTSCKVLRTDYTRLRSPSKKALCQNSRWNQIRKSLNDCYRIILSALESLKWSQSCSVMLTLCNFMDCGLPGSSVCGILQARILEWVAVSFSRGPSQPEIKPRSPTFQADSLLSEPPGKLRRDEVTKKPCHCCAIPFSRWFFSLPSFLVCWK